MHSNTWTELHLGALADNIRAVRALLGPRPELIFVVKADAYGHGAAPVARHAWATGVRWFAVAHLAEAAELRDCLPGAARILILSPLEPGCAAEAARLRADLVLADRAHALALADHAGRAGVRLACHAKIDTGMGRIGFAWESAAAELAGLAACPALGLEGACTHFACADRDRSERPQEQVRRFRAVLAECERAGLALPFRHVSNSGGIVCDRAWDLSAVRPGILLYGYEATPAGLTRPILEWKTRVVQVKRVPAGFPVSYESTHRTTQSTTLATIEVGYADGYSRHLSNRGQVLVGGRRRPIAGRVTMNLCVADLGPQGQAAPGDEVVLLGTQGGEAIWANELAEWAGTISYEILTSIRTANRVQKD